MVFELQALFERRGVNSSAMHPRRPLPMSATPQMRSRISRLPSIITAVLLTRISPTQDPAFISQKKSSFIIPIRGHIYTSIKCRIKDFPSTMCPLTEQPKLQPQRKTSFGGFAPTPLSSSGSSTPSDTSCLVPIHPQLEDLGEQSPFSRQRMLICGFPFQKNGLSLVAQ